MNASELSCDPAARAEGAALTLHVETVVYRGLGLARDGGFVVFVPDTLPGETVRARIVRRHRRHAEARLVEVLAPSPHRRPPGCPLADPAAAARCPGCAYQHADYAEELRLKQSQFEELVRHQVRGAGDVFAPPFPAPQPAGYRSRIELHEDVQGGRRVLGYVGDDNRTVVDVPACPLAEPPINEALGAVRAALDAVPFAGRRVHTFRHTPADGAVHAVGRRAALPPTRLTEASALGPVAVPLGSFYQVNRAVADHLLGRVAALLAARAPAAAVDLYCGVGLFALAAARAGVPRVTGIDVDPHAIAAARDTAARMGFDGAAAFLGGSAEQNLRRALAAVPAAAAALIVDPPRAGLAPPVVRAILAARPATLIYIACAADTLARDLRLLAEGGYALAAAELADMFPRTPWFEALCVLHNPRCGIGSGRAQ